MRDDITDKESRRDYAPEGDEVRDEIDSAAAGGPGPEEIEPADTAEQDFASRNVIMSNTLQGGASPAAGGVIGTGGELGLQPPTDEEMADDEGKLPGHERRGREDEPEER